MLLAWWNPRTWGRKNFEGVFRELYASPTSKSGATVNWKTALQVTTAFQCARVIANGISQIPFRPYRKLDGGGREEATDHWSHRLLVEQPNEWQTSYEFREVMAFHLALCGNFFAHKNWVGAGSRRRIAELVPFTPGAVQVKRENDLTLRYTVTTEDGKVQVYTADQIWHVRGPSWDGWFGLECVKLAREALGLALASEEHGARMFSNGARMAGILESDQRLGKDQAKALREFWDEQTQGNENAFRTPIMWGGLKWKAVSQQNDHAQMDQLRRFQVEEVCRAMGVLPIMVGHSDKSSTYASAEQMFIAHVVHTMSPWYSRIEQAASLQLLSEEDRRSGLYFKFLANGLMRGAVKDRGDFYTKLFTVRAINPNEIRELEEFNPYAGGDEYGLPLASNQAPEKEEPAKETE